MQKKANSRQIGGNHYKQGDGTYDHWDWVHDCRLDYFEAAATKYLSRWWKKGGLQDLEKAEHYAAKGIELADKRMLERQFSIMNVLGGFPCMATNGGSDLWRAHVAIHTRRLALRYDLNSIEWHIMQCFADWRTHRDLVHAHQLLTSYIDEAKHVGGDRSKFSTPHPDTGIAGLPNPVPLEDSNKHADRAEAVEPEAVGFGQEMKG